MRCHGIGLFTSPEGIVPAVIKMIFYVGDLWLLPDTLQIDILEHIFHPLSVRGPTFFSLKWKLLLPGASFVPLILELMLHKLRSRSRAEKACLQKSTSWSTKFLHYSVSGTLTSAFNNFVKILHSMVDNALFRSFFLYPSPLWRNHPSYNNWVKERNGKSPNRIFLFLLF